MCGDLARSDLLQQVPAGDAQKHRRRVSVNKTFDLRGWLYGKSLAGCHGKTSEAAGCELSGFRRQPLYCAVPSMTELRGRFIAI